MGDFVHQAACGCRIVFVAATDFQTSRMESCGHHATRVRTGLWREALCYQANEAFYTWDLAGRPDQGEAVAAA